MGKDMITDLANILFPSPRAGSVTPPEAFDDAVDHIAEQREAWEQNFRAMIEALDEDPLLEALAEAAAARDNAERHICSLLAYGRHFTGGARPGYSWAQLADAAGLRRSTAERRIDARDVEEVRELIGRPAVDYDEAAG